MGGERLDLPAGTGVCVWKVGGSASVVIRLAGESMHHLKCHER